MLRTSFFEIFNYFLDELTFEDNEVLGIVDLRCETLEAAGYESTGYRDEHHVYEKAVHAPYHKASVVLLHKLYFYADEHSGSALSLWSGVRLTTLLKAYWTHRGVPNGSLEHLEFYFWDGLDAGAVIFEGNIVVRFDQRQDKGAYLVGTVESRLDKTGRHPGLAIGMVKECMSLSPPTGTATPPKMKQWPRAFGRLVRFIGQYTPRP
ncbi:hypothetical protein [Pseudomonas aegrilactucae]|uniref:Uncharacterized protein n=1 Tax=Pseudomonas aegrilactucae TaxID=2854028 RepID=A0A9Q3AF10_9PSED|nr:hypothetical protein [Pseudomonas aegrilactucae]MBV6290327.1 hypothetical protein [Pseudomonas aegrilactucae]